MKESIRQTRNTWNMPGLKKQYSNYINKSKKLDVRLWGGGGGADDGRLCNVLCD